MVVLLGTSCGRVAPLGEGAMEVTVRQVVGGGTRYLLVNRVHRLICQLVDGSESACPPGGFSSWCPDDTPKVRLSGGANCSSLLEISAARSGSR